VVQNGAVAVQKGDVALGAMAGVATPIPMAWAVGLSPDEGAQPVISTLVAESRTWQVEVVGRDLDVTGSSWLRG